VLAAPPASREAIRLAGEAVVFTTDPVGPAFASREAALDAYAGRVEDERTGAALEPQDRYCRLAEQAVTEPGRSLPSVAAAYAEGRRWPAQPPAPIRTVWRLQVSYWRIATDERPIEVPQARKARRAPSEPRPGDGEGHGRPAAAPCGPAAAPGHRPVRGAAAGRAAHRDAG